MSEPSLFYSDDKKNWIETYWCRLNDESPGIGILATIGGKSNPPDGGVRMPATECLRLMRKMMDLPVFSAEQLECLAADCLSASRARRKEAA